MGSVGVFGISWTVACQTAPVVPSSREQNPQPAVSAQALTGT